MRNILLFIGLTFTSGSSLLAQFQQHTFVIEVALNGLSATVNNPPDSSTICPQFPRSGANYIIRQGFIYNSGTLLQCGNHINDYVPCNNIGMVDAIPLPGCGITISNNEGYAQFDDNVIGDWDCRGWFTQNVAEVTEDALFDLSTQTFYFYDIPVIGGEGSITTDGAVFMNIDAPMKRSITGGTGKFKYVFGEVEQQVIGLNDTGMVNIRTTFHIYFIPQ